MDPVANILFGKTRQAVLAQLFEHPEKGCYLRELSKQTGISPGALQHELKQLYQADLVLRREDGNRVVYQANREHPIFSDLQAIVHKTCGLPTQIREALAPLAERIRFAALYGSISKGHAHARSDVDLLIVGAVGLDETLKAISPVEKSIGREISIRIYSQEDFHKRRTDKESFLTGVLKGPLEILLGEKDDT